MISQFVFRRVFWSIAMIARNQKSMTKLACASNSLFSCMLLHTLVGLKQRKALITKWFSRLSFRHLQGSWEMFIMVVNAKTVCILDQLMIALTGVLEWLHFSWRVVLA